MVSPGEKPRTRKKRPSPRIVDVRRVTNVTPYMKRVTFGGEQMDGFTSKGAAEHIRVFVPNALSGELVLPVRGPDGYAFPESQERPTSRAYTPRQWDPRTNELDVDFVIHGDGPGSEWASRVKVGDTAVISGQPGGAYLPETTVDWYLIGGDEAALPAIATLLEVLPSSMRTHVFIEVLNEGEEQDLAAPSHIQLNCLHRDSSVVVPGRMLETALREVEIPLGAGRI
jgi:NADPH-dependent ferric siderophore reductase